MMLEIVAKCENGLFKKLSYFRLEIYKKYGARYTAKIKTVENSVESVERFAILPQDMGLFSPFCPGFSPYFGVRP